ncbi:MAG: flap structure-specific endonuclease [Nanoarchaeota archaeon]
MGVNLKSLVKTKQLDLEDLRGKKLAVDAYLTLYQFLTTMPQLSDSKGRLTNYLSGLFYRSTNLMASGIKLCYVFDGISPSHKFRYDTGEWGIEHEYLIRITPEIRRKSIELLEALGLPIIEAPSEGEAQCAYMCRKGKVWATASQDYDALLFGSPRLIRNLTLAKYRKLPKGGSAKVNLELIDLKKFLKENKINQRQLIALGMLIGTDFNDKIQGIGPKKAVKFVQKKSSEQIFQNFELNYNWKEIYNLFAKIPVTDKYKLKWSEPNRREIMRILVKEHNFNGERVETALNKIN